MLIDMIFTTSLRSIGKYDEEFFNEWLWDKKIKKMNLRYKEKYTKKQLKEFLEKLAKFKYPGQVELNFKHW